MITIKYKGEIINLKDLKLIGLNILQIQKITLLKKQVMLRNMLNRNIKKDIKKDIMRDFKMDLMKDCIEMFKKSFLMSIILFLKMADNVTNLNIY